MLPLLNIDYFGDKTGFVRPGHSLCFTPQLQQTEDVTEFRELVNSHCDLIFDSGYQKPVATSTLANKEEIVTAIFLHQTVFSCLAELNQLKRGLNVLGVINELTESPDILLDFFTAVNRVRLTAGWYFTYTIFHVHVFYA